jgi:hypothetical protein
MRSLNNVTTAYGAFLPQFMLPLNPVNIVYKLFY